MNFTSFHFVFFFLITITVGHFLKNRTRALRVFLLLSSLYFYGVFKPVYLILISVSTAYDYIAALGIEARREYEKTGRPPGRGIMSSLSKGMWLAVSMILNLSLLGFFKYTNFGIEIVNDTIPTGDTIFAFPALDIILPVGISFYTFQSMSYTIDVYRGQLEARRNLVDFALYVTFFPQLVAGPIVRATTFFKQMDDPLPVTYDDIVVGVTRIISGFFRKLVLADNLAPLVNGVFSGQAQLNPLDIWIGSLAFGWQIYFDFAGYTDIARGVARLFGYEFEINFLYPFSAGNITDHWSRWHISLTTWLRDYLYIPLGGSRVGTFRLYANLFIVWLATGIWHGASYHFVAWGIWQFVMVVVHRLFSMTELRTILNTRYKLIWGVVARLILFFFLNFGFIWFRAPDMAVATQMQGRLFGIENLQDIVNGLHAVTMIRDLPASLYTDYLWFLVFLWIYELYFNYRKLDYFWKPENRNKLVFLLTTMVFLILVLATPDTPNFLYFQF
jgi:D-alanyl-lipoteichoic acid acyltransferase DltB (MBOAT superfamily)